MKFRSRPPLPALTPSHQPERRDPSAATRVLRFSSPGLPQVSDWDATRAIGLAYYGNVFVYRCVECISTDVASLPVRVGPDPDRPDDYNPKAPLAKLLSPPPGGPAPGISSRRLWMWSTAQRAITGKLAWEIERGTRDQPIAFWPLAAGMLEVVPSTSGTAYFSSFRYGRWGDQRTLKPSQVFYSWRPGQTDWRQPESVLQSARLPVSVAVMMDRYNYAFLKNDARPAAVVVHQAFAESEERDAWRGKFLAEHEGPDQAGRPVFVSVDVEEGENVTGMLDIKTLGLSQRDARFIETYATTIRAITVAYGVPLSRLGDASERTFSNAGEEMDMYWGSTIPGWTTELADDVNISLAPQFNDDLVMWFDYSRQTKGRTRVFAAASPVDLQKAGIVTADEVRHDLGLAPLPAREPEPVPAPVVPALPALPAAAAAPRREGHDERALKALERICEAQWRSLFARQEKTTLSRLTGRRGHVQGSRTAPDVSAVFDRAFWEAETTGLVTGLLEAAAELTDARGDIPARAKALAIGVTEATLAAVREALSGERAGMVERVRNVFADAVAVWAPDLARKALGLAKPASEGKPEKSLHNGHRTLPVDEAERRLVLVHLGKMQPEEMTG